ncbi:hypothetical protein INR49_004166, partial [Caranx melampygus]
MEPRGEEDSARQKKTSGKLTFGIWKKIVTSHRWIFVVCLAGVLPPCCSGVHVSVRDEKRYTVLFQSVVLPCQYTSVSTQTPVVQWIYKSYCRDRTRDSFSFPDSMSGGLGGGGGGGGGGLTVELEEPVEDNSRTVRTVASISGSAVTLSEYYKNRDISIINSFSGVPEDLLPDFDLKIMPEWVFVAAVALGSVLFLLLVGVCWCQCCPHSCCCYVSCWCCPDTCCCPRH